MSIQILLSSTVPAKVVPTIVSYDPSTRLFTASEAPGPGPRTLALAASGETSDMAVAGLAAMLAARPPASVVSPSVPAPVPLKKTAPARPMDPAARVAVAQRMAAAHKAAVVAAPAVAAPVTAPAAPDEPAATASK